MLQRCFLLCFLVHDGLHMNPCPLSICILCVFSFFRIVNETSNEASLVPCIDQLVQYKQVAKYTQSTLSCSAWPQPQICMRVPVSCLICCACFFTEKHQKIPNSKYVPKTPSGIAHSLSLYSFTLNFTAVNCPQFGHTILFYNRERQELFSYYLEKRLFKNWIKSSYSSNIWLPSCVHKIL